MRSINPTSLAEAKNRLLMLVLAAAMLTLSPAATQAVRTISAPVFQKVQQWHRESREMINFSRRLYRFYKLSSDHPVTVARISK